MATGHIRKKLNKKGEVRYQIIVETERDPITGKRERSYKTIVGTKKQAEAECRKLIAEVEAGNPVTTSAVKVSAWMDEWLSLYCPNIESTTRAGYSDQIRNYIKPLLGHYPVNALKTSAIQKWVNELSKERNLSPKTIKNTFLNLSAAMEKAKNLRMIPYNPCKEVILPKLIKPKTEVYTKADLKKMFAAAKNTDFYLPLMLLAHLGLRRGELAGLKWGHIDLDKATVTIADTIVTVNGKMEQKAPKTEAGKRTLAIGDELVKFLRKERKKYFEQVMTGEIRGLGYVVHKSNGDPYNPDSLSQKWRRFTKAMNLKHIRLHDIRHTYATLMIQSGVDIKTVQHRLGHADISITMNTYAHCTQEMDNAAAKKMDQVLSSIA